MNAHSIRNALRYGESDSLQRRRTIIALAIAGLIDFSIISLYQIGIIRRLPDIPGELFDSNAVNASPNAYLFGVPDGIVSAFNYTTTMTLAAAGGTRQTSRGRIWDYLLAGSVLTNAAGAIYYLGNMIFKQKKICPYCVTGAALNLAMVPLAVQELRNG